MDEIRECVGGWLGSTASEPRQAGKHGLGLGQVDVCDLPTVAAVRLLIVFYLVRRGLISKPLLYISSYLEAHRREYYDRLQAVRERGEVQEWLQFFFTAVAVQAVDAVDRAERLHDLRETYRHELAGSRSRASEVVDLMFVNPVLTARRVAAELGVTPQGAMKLIRQLEDRGWVMNVGTIGRGGRTLWMAGDVFDTISDPAPVKRREPTEFTVAP